MQGEGRATGIALWIGGVCSLVLVILLNAQDPASREAFGNERLVLTAACLVPFGLACGVLAGRRILLLPAAVVAKAVGGVLWSGFPLLWVPAIAYVIAFARGGPSRLPWRWRVAAVVLPVLLGIAAVVLLFTNTTEHCAERSGYGACANVPPDWQLAAAAAAAFAAIALGWVVASPQRRGEISPRNPHVVGLVPHRQPQAK